MLSALARNLGRWLDGSGPAPEIVLSTRVRLARNLKEVPFTHRAREEQLAMIYSSVVSTVNKTPALAGVVALQMRELTPLDRQFLVERHLISNDLADNGRVRGLLVLPDESVSAMVNEEDHLRLQGLASGFQLRSAQTLVGLRQVLRLHAALPGHSGREQPMPGHFFQVRAMHDRLVRRRRWCSIGVVEADRRALGRHVQPPRRPLLAVHVDEVPQAPGDGRERLDFGTGQRPVGHPRAVCTLPNRPAA
jgi:hypothetical protein